MAAASDKAHLRSSPRFAVSSRCSIFYEDKMYKALVQDLSDGGMLLMCNLDFEPGAIVGVHLDLSAGVSIDCEVEVRNSGDMGIGVKIDFMDAQNRKTYQSYLQEALSSQLNKLG